MDKSGHCGNGGGNGREAMVLLMVPYIIRQTFIIIALMILSLACQQKPKEASTPAGNASGVQTLEESDAEMNEAIEAARSSLSRFEEAMLSNNPQYDLFALKVMFPDQVGGSEHIWITDLILEGGQYRGLVGNEPQYTIIVEAGQEVTVDPEKISDWMYVEDGKLRGGYTFRVLRNRMSPHERTEFDRSLGITIEE